MLVVLLIWTYVLFTTFLIGYAVLSIITSLDCMKMRKGKNGKIYAIHYHESYIVAGIIANTVYAELFSLAGGVRFIANLLLVLICVVIAVYYRNELLVNVHGMMRNLSSGRTGIYYVIILFAVAYGTAHGIMHYDSDLYHAQAIHWIENYGIIRGLGNLHVRLAYNSASFPLSALYSMSFITGKSYHVMSGFFALLLAWQCLDLKNIVRRGHIILSDFARIMALYYLFSIFDEIVAPASDYFLSTIVFYIIIHWLDMNVRHEHSYVPYILLTLTGVYAVTIKLSAAPILILSVVPIYMLLHERSAEKMRAFWISIVIALIISIPFFVRNIIISGWLIYPVTFLNFFNFPWKIPKGVAEFDAKEIKTFGRGYNDVLNYGDVKFSEWIVNWFNNLGTVNKIMLILDMIAIVLYLFCVVYFVIVAINQKTEKKNKLKESKVFNISRHSIVRMMDFITLEGTIILCLIFWLFSAPLIRYGEVYVFLTFSIVFGRLFIAALYKYCNNKNVVVFVFRCFVTLLSVWIIYKGINILREDVHRFDPAYLVDQQDYGEYEVDSFSLGDMTVYYPKEGDRVGYYPFPAATNDVSDKIELMGDKVIDGIKSIN